MTGDHEAQTFGALLRKIRLRRGLTLEEVANRAGISIGFLSDVELGHRQLDRLSHWMGVAEGLDVPLSDLLRLDLPAPRNGGTDGAIEAVRDALDAVAVGFPGGSILLTEQLRRRVSTAQRLTRQCMHRDVGRLLP